MHDQITVYRGRTIRSTGDGVFAAFDGPARAIRCALSAVDAARTLDVEIRAGLHTGECQLAGDLAAPRQVLVSGTVRDLVVGSNIMFDYRGVEALAGVPGEWRLFTVAGPGRSNGRS